MSVSTFAYETRRGALLARLADYADLTRPRIGLMVLVTVTVGALLGSWGAPDLAVLLHALSGTALLAASSGALNQWLERDLDARMPRTASRPLPAGRLRPGEVLLFGVVSGAAGLIWLAAAAGWLTAFLGLLTWGLYVWVYTPLKLRTSANTAVGAISGALPAMMGWSAVGGPASLEAATLFLIVYLWQFPHFMAIAWLYRREYAAAGMQMLSVVDSSGRRAGRQAVLAAAAVAAVSLAPLAAYAGPLYLAAALALGAWQLSMAIRFQRRLDEASARGLLRTSLLYLPAVLILLMLAPLT